VALGSISGLGSHAHAPHTDFMSIDPDPSQAPPGAEQDHETHITLADIAQVHAWATKLGVTPEKLREALAEVGPRVCDIRRRLAQPELAD